MTKEVATTPGAGLAQFLRPQGGAIEGFDGIDDRDLNLKPPELRIRQPINCKPGQTAGVFYLGTIEAKELTVVILKSRKYRALYEEVAGRNIVTCAAMDWETPEPAIEEPKAATCKECAWGQWDELPTGGRKPPRCDAGWALLGVWPEQGFRPFWLRAAKSAFQAGQSFLQGVRQWNANHPRPDDPERISHLCDLMVRLSLEAKKSPKGGNYYVPVFEPSLTPKKERALYVQMYGAVKDAVYSAYYGTDEESPAPEAGNGKAATESEAPF